LLKTVGVKVEEIKSTPLKAAPSPFEPTSPEARAAIEAVVLDSYDWFRGLVRENRKVDGDLLARVSDGRVFTGRQAIDLKLVDELGDEKQAIAWLAKEKGVDPKTRVRNYDLEPRFRDLPFLHVAASWVLEAVGLGTWARQIETWGTMRAIERLNLDGLLALWHPSTN
jgi:protease-4